MIEAGRLRHRVNIQSVTNTQDATTGEVTASWATTHADVPCAIEPLSVKDYLQSRADQSDISVRIVLRFISGLEPNMRLVGACACHSGKIYNPGGWLEDKESGREYLTAPCSEGVNEG